MTIPEMMTAVGITEPGGPEVLRPEQRVVPTPGAGEVLVRVAAAGVNRPDVMQRQGNYPPPPGASDIPGLEISGTVVACGPGVEGVEVGAAVCCLVQGGGYAEYCVCPAALLMPVPKGLSFIEAAALPETYFTVWTNVFERGRLAAGERILIHGGSSGIGTTAIQLARAFGARAIVTAGSEEKCAACIGIGAEAAINYRDEDFAARVAELTDNEGVDVVLDMVGEPYFERNVKCLRTEGRLVQIAVQQGFRVELNLLGVMMKRLTITGSTLRPRSVEEKVPIRDALEAKVWPLLAQGKEKPLVHETFPLAEASSAHAVMDASTHVGKLVLSV